MMADCIFCRIVGGEVPAAKLLETPKVVSFLDIHPVNPGHALVVPRTHAKTLLDLSEEEAKAAIAAIKRVASAVCQATGSPAFNVIQNNGAAAGQVVEHVHFHVVPRRPDDGFRFNWRQLTYAEGQLEKLQAVIRANL